MVEVFASLWGWACVLLLFFLMTGFLCIVLEPFLEFCNSLCRQGWTGTQRVLPTSASCMLGLLEYVTNAHVLLLFFSKVHWIFMSDTVWELTDCLSTNFKAATWLYHLTNAAMAQTLKCRLIRLCHHPSRGEQWQPKGSVLASPGRATLSLWSKTYSGSRASETHLWQSSIFKILFIYYVYNILLPCISSHQKGHQIS